jgi:hypothetical protein
MIVVNLSAAGLTVELHRLKKEVLENGETILVI